MDAKCSVGDGEGSLNFNPGVDVGLGLSGSLYQDSSPTITFHEHARGGQRHKQSIAVSLSMVPQAHITKETHFKIKDKSVGNETETGNAAALVINSPPITSQPVTSHAAEETSNDVTSQVNDVTTPAANSTDEPLEFHNVTWYSSTLHMAPHALARQCQSTLFIFPKDHTQKKFFSAIEVYMEDFSNDTEHLHNGYDLLNGDEFREL